MMNKRILVVAPHCDDESFGIGGTILKRLAADCEVEVVVMVAGDVHFEHSGGVISRAARVEEFFRVLKAYGCAGHVCDFEEDSRLDTVPLVSLVNEIETVQDRVDASVWYIPAPSFHQDHRHVFEACIAAARPTRRTVPDEIYAYELATYSWNPPQWRFRPQLYEDITHHLDRKIEICRMYKSQFREGVLGVQHIREFSVACGTEIGFGAAERFEVIRVRRR